VSPHDLRRTFVSDTLSASPDALTISALSGTNHPKENRRAGAKSKFPYSSLGG